MSSGLKRYQHAQDAHYLTFTCYHRHARLSCRADSGTGPTLVRSPRLRLCGHARARPSLTQRAGTRRLVGRPANAEADRLPQNGGPPFRPGLAKGGGRAEPFWQSRYYDFNVWSQRKFREKLRYMHRNPVRRGLVTDPEEWLWSSYRHYLTGIEGTVEIESEWTARKLERMGAVPRLKLTRS